MGRAHKATAQRRHHHGSQGQHAGSLRHRIDTAWQPDAKGTAFAADKGITDLAGEVERFRDYHLARGSLMRDWSAAWRAWCSNDRKFRERRGSAGTGRKQPGESKLGWLADHFGRGEGESS